MRVTDPFGTSPGALKLALIVAQLAAAVAALLLLRRASRGRRMPWRRPRWQRVWWIDAGVIGVFAGWAVIGPLAVDDGWATMIARTFAATGTPGNYYRWWNAAEVPFALGQQLLSPLTSLTLAPLWLRLPSTVLAVATWFVLSRGVLGAALGRRGRSAPVRLLAAASLLAAWLPFNLGTRPESYVALGVTAVLALAMRSRSLTGLGAMVAVVALTVPISPNAVLVLAPIVVFAPRLAAVLRASAPTKAHLWAHVLLLCCVGAVSLTLIFADQSWDALTTATDWHTFFGPTLPWYDEAIRYRYLFSDDQQGSAAKRFPVVTSAAMLAAVAMTVIRARGRRSPLECAAARLAVVVLLAVGLFALAPSKWSYHFGAAAGLFAATSTVAVVMVVRRSRSPDRRLIIAGIAGSAVLAAALALAFDGPNAWWLPAMYDVPWADSAPTPLGIPLNDPLVWLGLTVVATAALAMRRGLRQAISASPAILLVSAYGVVLALLIGSFVAAPVRRPAGSLALANLHRIDGTSVCGLADEVELLPDGPVLAEAGEPGAELDGFSRQAGFPSDAPPPDPPGIGTSAFVWGSYAPDWQPHRGDDVGLVRAAAPGTGRRCGRVSVSGRTDGGNLLTLEFGRTDGPTVTPLGEHSPADRPASDEDPAHPLWRSIGVDGTDVPAGADRVRIRAVDARTDPFGWLAFTGPRLRSTVPLDAFLADNGPVLISWPLAFLFPCVLDVATVSGGVASTPRTVIESPRPFFVDDRDRTIGGTFHELVVFGDLYEIPSRLVGAPDVDWGSVRVSGDPAARDDYLRTVERELLPGATGTGHQRPER